MVTTVRKVRGKGKPRTKSEKKTPRKVVLVRFPHTSVGRPRKMDWVGAL